MKEWEEFENLVTKIHAETSPDAVVQRNHHVTGQLGRRRQLDITISKRVGLYHVLIVIECKRYNRPVGIDRVEAFVTKLRDVGASQGVMVSNKGFSKGARAVAARHVITLLSYREAQSADWCSIIGSGSWFKLYRSEIQNERIIVVMPGGSEHLVPSDMPLLNEHGHPLCSTNAIFEKTDAKKRLKLVGDFTIEVTPATPLFISQEGRVARIDKLLLKGLSRAWEYIVNMKLASGHILEDNIDGTQLYHHLVTEGIDWTVVLGTQAGREISEEELKIFEKEGTYVFYLDPTKPYIRLILKNQHDKGP